MGFNKPNLDMAELAIRHSLAEISHPGNDGFTSSYCKQELYMLKCWLEEEYTKLPTFVGEEQWEQKREQDRVLKILKNN
jgi:hypothetical protein